jgi:hypothetical protein
LLFIRKLYIVLKLGLFISESGPSLRSDCPIARIGKPGGTVPGAYSLIAKFSGSLEVDTPLRYPLPPPK